MNMMNKEDFPALASQTKQYLFHDLVSLYGRDKYEQLKAYIPLIIGNTSAYSFSPQYSINMVLFYHAVNHETDDGFRDLLFRTRREADKLGLKEMNFAPVIHQAYRNGRKELAKDMLAITSKLDGSLPDLRGIESIDGFPLLFLIARNDPHIMDEICERFPNKITTLFSKESNGTRIQHTNRIAIYANLDLMHLAGAEKEKESALKQIDFMAELVKALPSAKIRECVESFEIHVQFGLYYSKYSQIAESFQSKMLQDRLYHQLSNASEYSKTKVFEQLVKSGNLEYFEEALRLNDFFHEGIFADEKTAPMLILHKAPPEKRLEMLSKYIEIGLEKNRDSLLKAFSQKAWILNESYGSDKMRKKGDFFAYSMVVNDPEAALHVKRLLPELSLENMRIVYETMAEKKHSKTEQANAVKENLIFEMESIVAPKVTKRRL